MLLLLLEKKGKTTGAIRRAFFIQQVQTPPLWIDRIMPVKKNSHELLFSCVSLMTDPSIPANDTTVNGAT